MTKTRLYKLTFAPYLLLVFLAGVHEVCWSSGKPQHVPSRAQEGPYAHTSFDELVAIKNNAIEKNNITVATQALERLVRICTDVHKSGDLILELADIYFKGSHFAKSAVVYNQFVTFYPGSEKVEYALYRAVLAESEIMRPADRCQQDTKRVIELADKFLKNEQFLLYRGHVEGLRARAYARLFEHEESVCMFYLNRRQMVALSKRLDFIRTTLLTKENSLEPRILDLELRIFTIVGDQEMITAKREQLVNQHLPYLQAQEAQQPKTFFSWCTSKVKQIWA